MGNVWWSVWLISYGYSYRLITIVTLLKTLAEYAWHLSIIITSSRLCKLTFVDKIILAFLLHYILNSLRFYLQNTSGTCCFWSRGLSLRRMLDAMFILGTRKLKCTFKILRGKRRTLVIKYSTLCITIPLDRAVCIDWTHDEVTYFTVKNTKSEVWCEKNGNILLLRQLGCREE